MNQIKVQEMEGEHVKVQFRNTACFFAFGFIMVFLSEVASLALTDMLGSESSPLKVMDGNFKLDERSPSGTEIAAIVMAGFAHIIIKISLPCLNQKIPRYVYKLILLCFLYVAGFVVIFASDSPVARLIGVVAIESSTAAAEVVFLSLTAFYGDTAVTSFVAGGGLSGVLGHLYFAGMLEWTCVSPRIIVAVSTPLVSFFLMLYAFLVSSSLDQKSQGTAFAGVRYSALHDQRMSKETHELNISEKCITAWHIYMPMVYLFLQYFADDLSIQALVAPLAYPHRALFPMGRFMYYALAHNIGVLIGRVYLLVVSITCSSAIRHVQIKSTWSLTTAGNALMFLFVFAAWFRFLREVEAILVMCFLIGLVTGGNYANSALHVHQQTTDASRREFALGLLTLGSSAGSYASGLLGLFLKPYLTTHCLFELRLGNSCFPKFAYFFSWEKNVRCY